jgi:hypothetical protein
MHASRRAAHGSDPPLSLLSVAASWQRFVLAGGFCALRVVVFVPDCCGGFTDDCEALARGQRLLQRIFEGEIHKRRRKKRRKKRKTVFALHPLDSGTLLKQEHAQSRWWLQSVLESRGERSCCGGINGSGLKCACVSSQEFLGGS